jgi:acyl carrier protein
MIMSPSEIASSIEKFIRREFRVAGDDPGFSEDSHLFESGYVDSVGVVELIAFVESRFGVKLEDEQIFSEQFTTISGISRMVGQFLAENHAAAAKPAGLRSGQAHRHMGGNENGNGRGAA